MALFARAFVITAIMLFSGSGCCGVCAPLGGHTSSSGSKARSGTRSGSAIASARPRTTSSSGPLRLSAGALIRAYEKDERAADRMYKGRPIRTKGWIAEVNPGTLANPTIMIGPSRDTDPLEDSMVQCRVTDRFVRKAKTLVVGKRVVVSGTGRGMRLGQVRLEDCSIVSGGR